jgi:hypothetical protein
VRTAESSNDYSKNGSIGKSEQNGAKAAILYPERAISAENIDRQNDEKSVILTCP